MKKSLLIIILFIMPFSYAGWYVNSEQVNVSILLSGGFEIQRQSDSSLQYVIANLSFIPKENYRQKIQDLKTSPNADISSDMVTYQWNSPGNDQYEFQLKSDIIIQNKRNKVNEKVDFPIKNTPIEYNTYTLPSQTIDSDDDDIIKLANTLAEGEDDLFVVVHKIAEWTKGNIIYNLSTLTASVTQSSSWVLENRKGVCDELTNLFIAMVRSLGIPAKFISGDSIYRIRIVS